MRKGVQCGVAEPPSTRLQSAADLFFQLPLSDQGLFWQAFGAVLLLLVSAGFSLGLLSFSKFLNEKRDPGVRWGDPLLSLASLQLGRSLAAFGFVALASLPLIRSFGRVLGGSSLALAASVVLTVLLLAFVYVVVVLQLAKLASDVHARRALQALQAPFRLWRALSYPVSWLIVLLGNVTRRWVGVTRPDAASQAYALRRLLEEDVAGSSDQQERQLLRNVLEFTEAVASDMMMPRPDVAWLATDSSLDAVLEQVRESGHTRFPLCDGTPDKVVGYLHAKDLTFLRPAGPAGQVDFRKLARPVAFVPETARAMTLLERFQKERSHMAVVVDEFGGMSGIITLEDILEELVGEIQDEFDAEEADIEALEGGDLLVDGGVHLEDLEERLGLSFGDVEEETLGGYIFGRLAREVTPGDEVSIYGALLRVEAVDGLRVTRVHVQRRSQPASEPEEEEPLALDLPQNVV